jgi:hypothetical protein
MEDFLQAAVGAIVWTFANVVYLDLRRKGTRNFGRFAAFWVGNPATWITLFLVKERRVEQVEPPPDDDDRLLREIHVDRELRGREALRAIGGGGRADGETPRTD